MFYIVKRIQTLIFKISLLRYFFYVIGPLVENYGLIYGQGFDKAADSSDNFDNFDNPHNFDFIDKL